MHCYSVVLLSQMIPLGNGELCASASPSTSEGKDNVINDSLKKPDPSNGEESAPVEMEDIRTGSDAAAPIGNESTRDDTSTPGIVGVYLPNGQISIIQLPICTSIKRDEQRTISNGDSAVAQNALSAGGLFRLYLCFLFIIFNLVVC